MKLLFYGAGAVNLSLIGLLDGSKQTEATLLARGEALDQIANNGIHWSIAATGKKGKAHPQVIATLQQTTRPDVVVLGVKAYQLEAAITDISTAFGPNITVLALQNGIEHLERLNAAFTQMVYGSVWYNCHKPSVSTVVSVNAGPLSLSPASAASANICAELVQLLGQSVPTVAAPNAVHMLRCKLLINLSNSVVSLIGLHRHGAENPAQLQILLSAMLYEALAVLRATGTQELKVPGSPSWLLITLNAKLPTWLTAPMFRKKLGRMSISSMAQDLEKDPSHTELEAINGAFVRWAEACGVEVPINKAVLEIGRQRFGQGFTPMSMDALFEGVFG